MSIESKESIATFWNSRQGAHGTTAGFGGGHELETDYRTHFEWRHLKKIVPLDSKTSLLEMGSGDGRWAVILAPLIKQYEGVEFSEILVETARQAAEKHGLENVQFRQCSVTEVSTAGEQYDVIYFAGVTQYLSDEEFKQALDNMAPSMKPTTVIVERSTVRYKKREVRNMKATCYTIYRTPEEIKDIFAASGFRLYYQNRSYRFLRGFNLLNRFFFRGPFAPLKHALAALIRTTKPFSLYPMLWFSVVADTVWPAPWNKGDGSHDFFLFKRDEALPTPTDNTSATG